jgi:hypothetical protein
MHSCQLFRGIYLEFYFLIGAQLKARDNTPLRFVSFWIIQPEVRAAAFRAAQRSRRQDAPQQNQVTHGQPAFELIAALMA